VDAFTVGLDLVFLILGVIVFSTYVEGLILALIFDSFLFLGMTTLSWESFLGFTCLVSIILIFRTLISRYLVIVYN